MRAYGSGHFGRWITDEAGLPAYEYTCNHHQDPAAEYMTGRGPSRDHYHLLGNAHASAIAHNEGYVELFRPDTVGSWLNRYAPNRRAYAGGFGFLRLEHGVTSTLYRHLGGPLYRRIWGVGYFRKRAAWGDLAIDQLTFIPYGNDPVLVNLTTLSNRGERPLSLSYYEYWDVLPTPVIAGYGEGRRIAAGLRVLRTTRFDQERRLLICSPAGRYPGSGLPAGARDPDPPVAFLAAIDGRPVPAFESSKAAFFGEGGLDGPSALRLPFLGRSVYAQRTRSDRIVLVLQRDVAVPPGEQVRLAHLFGYGSWDSGRPDATGSETPAGLVERYAARPARIWLNESLEKWREALVHLEVPEDSWVSREVAWNSYYGQALAALDAYTGETYFDHGGHYTYDLGRRTPPRDICRHALALLPNNPAQVRGTIRHLTRLCRPNGSLLPAWAPQRRHSHTPEPSDLHLWFLWLIADYILYFRDRAFAEQEVPLYPQAAGKTTTIRRQVRRSLDYLRRVVGLGRHGLLRLLASDGNDALPSRAGVLTRWALQRHGESIFNSGLAGVVLPRVAELCRWLGEAEWAEEAEEWAEANRQALAEAWNGHWFDRILAPGGRIGRDELFLDCQPWVVLAGGATDTQEFILFHKIRERLAAHLPGLPADTPPPDGLCSGASFAAYGPLIWAWAQSDPAAAWVVLKACTLASHAEADGERWYGIWSGPDSLTSLARDAPAGPRPRFSLRGLPLFGNSSSGSERDFPIANGHSANQLLFAVAHLAGLQPDARGFQVRPRLPFERFSLETVRLGLRCRERSISGHIVPQGNDAVEIRVECPGRFADLPEVRVDGRPVLARLSADRKQVSFRAFVRGGLRTEWEVIGGAEGNS